MDSFFKVNQASITHNDSFFWDDSLYFVPFCQNEWVLLASQEERRNDLAWIYLLYKAQILGKLAKEKK